MASSLTSFSSVKLGGPGGRELFFEEEGDASNPAIVFIHGLGGTTNTFQPLVSSLSGFHLIRFDLSGHGRSPVPVQKTSIASYVEDTKAIIDHSGVQKPTIVAHSLGCLVAMHFAATHPEVSPTLVLFGPIRKLPQAGREGTQARAANVRSKGMAAVADTVISNALAPETLKSRPELAGFARELLCRQDSAGYAMACDALAGAEDPEWSKVKARVVIVSGAQDKVSAPAICSGIKEALGGTSVELVSWDGVGHWHTLENAKGAGELVESVAGKGA